MANKATVDTTHKNKSKWLTNAMKSIGASTTSSLKSIYPNLAEVGSASFNASKTIVSSIRNGRTTVRRVTETLKNNKYVQYANKAYKNALSDFKSGNFDQTDRMMGFDDSDFSGFDDFDDVSFGDEDTPVTNNINVTSDDGTRDAVLNLSSNVQKQSENMMKTNKATMDAYLSISAASMYQIEKLGGEINTHLSNINNSLSAIVQYQNENMNKFMEASMAFYEQMGSKLTSNDDYMSNDKVTAVGTFSNGKGGINLSRYKAYVKSQLKESLSPEVAMVVDMLDDSTLEMVTSNPLGFATNALTTYMIPKLVGTTISNVEKTFETFVPTMLERLADFGETYTDSMFGKLTRYAARSFGLKRAGTGKKLESTKIERGAIPFDGETKHAITQVITKELRDQTAYLRAIAEKVVSKRKIEQSMNRREYWDYATESYQTQDKLRGNIAEMLSNSMIEAFSDTDFYKKMSTMIAAETDEKNRGTLENTFNLLLSGMAKHDQHINLNDMSATSEIMKVVNSLNAKQGTDTVALEELIGMIKNLDTTTRQTSNIGRIKAREAVNKVAEELSENSNTYNLRDAGVEGVEAWDLVNEDIYNKRSKKYKRKHGARREANSLARRQVLTSDTQKTGLLGHLIAPATERATSFMEAVMAGDFKQGKIEFKSIFTDTAKGIFETVRDGVILPMGETIRDNVLSPMKNMIFGKKNNEGFSEGGLLSGLKNKSKDIFNAVKYEITGEEYTDSDGVKHETKDKTVVSSVKSLGSKIKKGIMIELFGEDEVDDDGNPTGNKKSSGLLNSWKIALSDSLNRFKTAVFGEKDEFTGGNWGGFISHEAQEYMKEKKIPIIAGAGTGSIIGTILGGPVLGAGIGIASSLISSSDKFKGFLFGDENQLGLINGIKKAFAQGRGIHDVETNTEFSLDTQFVGKAGIGLIGGIIASAFLPGGPVMGGLLGLGASIAGSGKDFKKFLFGEDEVDENGNPTGVHKHGLLGKVGNMINAQFLRPVKTQLSYYVKKTALDLEYTVGDTFNFMAEIISEKVGDVVGSVQASFKKMANEAVSFLKKNILDNLQNIVRTTLVEPVSKAVTGAASLVYTIGRKMVIGPVEKIQGMLDVAYSNVVQWWQKSSFKNFIDDGKDWLKKAIKNQLKWIGRRVVNVTKLALSPLGLVFKGMSGLGTLIGHSLKKHGIELKLPKRKQTEDTSINEWDVEGATRAERWRKRRAQHKAKSAELKKQYQEQKTRDKNAKLIEKWTKGQYSSDTAEARLKAQQMSGGRIKLDTSVETEDALIQKAKAQITGGTTFGVSRDALQGTVFSTLSPEAQTVVLLDELIKVMRGEDTDKDSEAAKKFREESSLDSLSDAEKGDLTRRVNAIWEKHKKADGSIDYDAAGREIANSSDADKDRLLAMHIHSKKYMKDRKAEMKNQTVGGNNGENSDYEWQDAIELRGGVKNWAKHEFIDKYVYKHNKTQINRMQEKYDRKTHEKLKAFYRLLSKAIRIELKADDNQSTPVLDYFGSKKNSDYDLFLKMGPVKFANQIISEGAVVLCGIAINQDTLYKKDNNILMNRLRPYEGLFNKIKNIDNISLNASEGLQSNERYKKLTGAVSDYDTRENDIANGKKSTGNTEASTENTSEQSETNTGGASGRGRAKMVITHNNAPKGGRGILGLALGAATTAVKGVIGAGKAVIKGVTGIGRKAKEGVESVGEKVKGAKDFAKQSLNKIRGKGITQQDKIDAQEKAQDRATMLAIRENTAISAANQVEHTSAWKKMFSKKGLLTAGLLLMMPKIIKGVNWLLSGNGFSKIIGGVSNTFKSVTENGLIPTIVDLKEKAKKKLEEMFPETMKKVETVMDRFSRWHEEIDQNGGNIFKWADGKLTDSPIGSLYTSAKNVFTAYSTVAKALAPAALKLVKSIDWESITTALIPAAETIASVINTISDAINKFFGYNKNNKDGKSTSKRISEYGKKEKNAVTKIMDGDIVDGAEDFILNEDGEFDGVSAAKLKILANPNTLSKAPKVGKGLVKAGGKTAKGIGWILGRTTKTGRFARKVGKAGKKVGEAFSKTKVGKKAGELLSVGKNKISSFGKNTIGKFSKFKSNVSGLSDLAMEYGDDAYKMMGESKFTNLTAKGLTKVRNVANTAKSATSNLVGKFTGTRVGGAVATGLSKTGKALAFVNKKGGAKELATKIVKSDAVKSVAQKVKNSAAGEGIEAMVKKLLSKLIKAYKWVGEKLGKKIGKKVATEAAEAAAEKGIKSAMKKGGSKFVKMITTGIAKISGKIAAAASTASIADAAFFTLGAIDYGSKGGTARLFQIDEEYVDAKMRIISTVIGGLLQVSWGAWVDLANELVASFKGINLISELACLLYKAISGKKKDNKLDEAREDFKADYDEYVDSKIEKEYQKQLEDGTLPKNENGDEMTLEEFTAAVERGDVVVKHKSFDEYNKDKHKGTWAKVGSAMKKAGKATAKFFKKAGAKIKDTGKKAKKAVTKFAASAGNKIASAGKSIWGGIKSVGKGISNAFKKPANITGSIKSTTETLKNIKNKVKNSKAYKFLTTKTSTGYFDADGSYYLANGKGYDHYSANGSKINEQVDTEEVNARIATGELIANEVKVENTVGKLVNFAGKKAKDIFKFYTSNAKLVFGKLKDRATRVWGGLTKFVDNPIETTKNFLSSHTEKAWYEQTGGYYVANGDTFNHYNANGDLIEDGISSETITELINSGTLTEGEIEVDSGLKSSIKTMTSNLKDSWNTVVKKGIKVFGGMKKTIGGIFDKISKNGVLHSIKKALTTKEAWFDPNGNYYVKSGKKYDYYNANNDLIEKGISADEVEEKIQTGLLTKGTIKRDQAAKNAIKKIQSAVKDSWDTAKKIAASGWSKFKKWLNGGSGSGIGRMKNSDYGYGSIVSSMGGSGSGFIHGGRGSDSVNGFPYFSQNDSEWKNVKYGNDGATMGDSGCGPAAMSMVASKLTGQSVSPLETASLAEATGDRDYTGTNWNFIGKASAAYGLSNTQASNPSSGFIRSQLENGHPMILSGASGYGRRGGHGESPYTDAGHYVVATGIDNAGNISISDPRGKSYSKKFNVDEVANQTGMAWSFGGMGGGFGSSYADKVGQVLADLKGPSYKAPINNLPYGQCTWYAEGRAHEKYGWDEFTRRAMGNGGEIYYNAKSWGLDSGTEIKPNSLISRGGSSSYGHVLYVEDVDKENNMVYYSEGNSDGSGHAPDDGVIKSASLDQWNARNPYGYVYTKGSNTYSDADGKGITSSGDTSDSNNSSGATFSQSENVVSSLTGFMGEIGNRLINGMFTGKLDGDFTSYFSGTTESSTNNTINTDNSGKSMIMIGDSRTVGICDALGGPNIQTTGYTGTVGDDIFIGKVGEGLAWLKSNGISLLRTATNKKVNAYIVIWLGVNDCAMGDPETCGRNYASYINENISHLGKNVYVVTPAPTEDGYGNNIINNSLPSFNKGLKSGLNSNVNFIDLYDWFKNGISHGLLKTVDGVHFDKDSYVAIIRKIKSSVGAGGGSGYGRRKPTITNTNILPNMWVDPTGGSSFYTGGGRGEFTITGNGSEYSYRNPLLDIDNLSGYKKKFFKSYPISKGLPAVRKAVANDEWELMKKAGSASDYTKLGNLYRTSKKSANHGGHKTFERGDTKQYVYTLYQSPMPNNGKSFHIAKDKASSVMADTSTGSSIREAWKSIWDKIKQSKKDNDTKVANSGDKSESYDNMVENEETDGLPNAWIDAVKYVKKVFADELKSKGLGYAWEGHTFDFGSKGKKNFRKDCTGFVSAALWYYGAVPDDIVPAGGWTSHCFGGSNNDPKLIAALDSAGFKRMDFPGWDNLQCGDILIKHEYHGEIYCSGNSAANHQSWNCGSTEGLWANDTIYGADYSYEEIWRPPASEGSRSSSSNTGASSDNIISGMTSFMGEVGNRLVNGMFTGKFDSDFSSYFAGTSSDGSNSASTGVTVDGKDARSITWNYFTKKGYSKAATAGLMGNIEKETYLDTNNKAFPAGNDKNDGVSTAEWKYGGHREGTGDDGGGLIQWTPWYDKIGAYSKKKTGDNLAWTKDLPMQLEYIEETAKDAIGNPSDYSLAGADMTKSFVNDLEGYKKMDDVDKATRQWQAGVERPSNQYAHLDRRLGAAKWFYDNMESVNTGGGSGTGTHISKPKYGTTKWVQGSNKNGHRSITYTPSHSYNELGTQVNKIMKDYAQSVNSINMTNVSNVSDELLLKAVDILADIATNTGVASDKLDMLKSLGQKVSQTNVISTGNTTNNSVNNVSASGSGPYTPSNPSESRNSILARRIASGV